ncbi:hypothetical protein AX14_011892 [Amanita brunnescens Koide BX004]|nr:hypothetical protein AX14_011892 [Amanita brunnescens Koide BX004]
MPRWCELCKTWKKKDKNLPRDVHTRWNSTYDMLDVAIDYRDIIDHLCSEQEPGLRKFKLDPEEWLITTQLRNLLKVQCNSILFEIEDFQPNNHHPDKHLATGLTGADYSLSIHSAIHVGIKTLNKYYSKTDQSEQYRISVVLDPHYKLAYFQKLKWPKEWIDKARDLTTAAFADYSKSLAELVSNGDDFMIHNPQFDDDFQKTNNTSNIFDDLINDTGSGSASGASSAQDELTLYLNLRKMRLMLKTVGTRFNSLTSSNTSHTSIN